MGDVEYLEQSDDFYICHQPLKEEETFRETLNENKAIAAFCALTLIGMAGFIAVYTAKDNEHLARDIKRCLELKGDTYRCDNIKKRGIPSELKADASKARTLRKEVLQEKANQEIERKKKKAEETRKFIAEYEAKQRAKAAAERKALEGWTQQEPGIYVRWCTESCSRAEVIGNSAYWLMEVWCKDRSCGDIYAQMNILRNGTVVGWTNDTMYLSKGQKGVLTFQKYSLPGGGAAYQGQLVKFSAHG